MSRADRRASSLSSITHSGGTAVNMIAKHKSSTFKILPIAVAAMAISLWTASKARADEGASPAGTPGDGRVVQQVLDLDRSEEQISRAVKPRLTSPQAWNLA